MESGVHLSTSDSGSMSEGCTDQSSSSSGDVAGQLSELQNLVCEMKSSFGSALEVLTEVQQGDQLLQAKVQTNNDHCEEQIHNLTDMVLALKHEFAGLVTQVQRASSGQHALKHRVSGLICERDILLEELEHAGVIDEEVKSKYHSGQDRPDILTRSQDSTLSTLLENAHNSYNNSSPVTSDRDSGVNTAAPGELSSFGEQSPPKVSPMMESYIAGLQAQEQDDPDEDMYDSDSSLTAAANKSLDLSRSLGDRCAELTRADLSDDDEGEGKSSKGNKDATGTPLKDGVSPKPPGSARKTPPHERNTRDLQRARVANEILETERKYCVNLWTILDHFVEPMREEGLATVKEINLMFPSCLSRVYEHHCVFLQRLEERLSNWRWQGVLGDVFARFFDPNNCDLLTQYQTYVNEFPHSLHNIRKNCRHTKFRKFLRRQQSDPVCENLDIASFLLNPIQRVPRYVLLLKQLLRFTPPEHPDHYYIEMSLARLGAFLNDLNDSIAHSMKVVAGDATPKPKRRLRVGSLMSNSLGSYDAIQAGYQTGVRQATVNRVHSQSIHPDRRCPRPQLDPSYPRLGATYPVPSSRTNDSSTFAVPAPPYDCHTMPLRRQPKTEKVRPSSGDFSHFPGGSLSVFDPECSLHESSLDSSSQHDRSLYSGIGCKRTLMKQPSSGYLSSDSFRSQASSGGQRYASPRRSAGLLEDHGYARPMSQMSLRGGGMGQVDFGQVSSSSIHQSMLHINDKFGIYGDEDDMEDLCDATSATELARVQRLQKLARSRSYAERLHMDASSLSQRDINISLAKSLAANHSLLSQDRSLLQLSDLSGFSPQGPLSRPKSEAAIAMQRRAQNEGIRKPPRPKSVTLEPEAKAQSWYESTFDTSALNTTVNASALNASNMSMASKKKGLLKRWNKENRSADDSIAKKKSFKVKNSFKNLFKKSRKCPEEDTNDNDLTLNLSSSGGEIPKKSVDINPTALHAEKWQLGGQGSLPREHTPAPPPSISLNQSVHPSVERDENGEPCSSV